jgi:hypothetical protein
MGPIGCPETSVQNYDHTLRNIPEGRRCHVIMWYTVRCCQHLTTYTYMMRMVKINLEVKSRGPITGGILEIVWKDC